MNEDLIYQAVHSWLTQATGLDGSKVIKAYQNATEPEGLYISVIPVLSMNPIGIIDEEIHTTEGELVTISRRTAMVQIDAYGAGSFGALNDAMDALGNRTIYESAFVDNSMSARQIQSITNTTALKGSRYEQRFTCSIEIEIGYDSTPDGSRGYFDCVEYDVEISEG